jgi:hypothetical protein
MQFNNHADNQDIVSLINDITGMDNNIYSLQAKTRDANTANRTIWTWIHEAYGGWQYDDANNTLNFPSALTSLVSNQRDYAIPSEALSIKGVEVKNTDGNWKTLTPVTEEKIRQVFAEKEFMDTSSQPMFYTPYANSLRIYPASDYSQASSLRVLYDRETSAFVSTDTTKTPGFNSLFHEAVAYGAGFFFARYKALSQKNDLALAWQDFEKRIKQFYSERYQQLFPSRITVNDATSEYS